MTDHIRIRTAPGIWSVRAGGAVLGETKNALVLSEGRLEDVIYFPREDLAMAFLERSEKVTHCPHKGDANYFSIVTKSETLADTAWSYETPLEGVREIANHIAFYADGPVTIEEL